MARPLHFTRVSSEERSTFDEKAALVMTTLKSRLKTSDFFTLTLILAIILFNAACGARRQPYSVTPRSGEDESDFFAAGLFENEPVENNSSDSEEDLMAAFGYDSEEGFLELEQAADNFGAMNSCYTQVVDQVGVNLGQGWGIAPLFRDAGMALVDCYNQVLTGLSQQYSEAGQGYQSSLYNHLVNENNRLIGIIASQQNQASKSNDMAKPPMKVAPQKKKKKK